MDDFIMKFLSPQCKQYFLNLFRYCWFVRSDHVGSGVPRNFFGVVQQIQLRTEGRENGDLGSVAL
jgi:hypothetical protein